MLGIVVAMPRELDSLSRHLAPNDIRCALSGVGPDRAYDAANRIVAEGATALLSWGLAGALRPKVSPGDVMIPDKVVDTDGNCYETDADWRARLREGLQSGLCVHMGILISNKRVAASTQSKKSLGEQTGAAAVDMESAGVARAAHEHRLPFAVVRVVSDDLATEIPPSVLAATDEYGNVRRAQLAARLLRSPYIIPSLIRIGLQFRSAKLSMNRIAKTVLAASWDDATDTQTLLPQQGTTRS